MRRSVIPCRVRWPSGFEMLLAAAAASTYSVWGCAGNEPAGPERPPQVVAAVEVVPSTAKIFALGETVQLTAYARNSAGNAIHGVTFTWSSSDETVATVSSAGLVTAVSAGVATIVGTSGGTPGTALVTVGPWVEVSTGARETCGLTSDGAAYCWESFSVLRPTAVEGGLTFMMIDTGAGYSCGVTTDGEAYCWGDNDWGQLGNGSFSGSDVPVAVAGGLTFSSISTMTPVGVGGKHTCAVTQSGEAYCWGVAHFGQLGVGLITGLEPCETFAGLSYCSSVPVPVAGGLAFSSVSTASASSCGLTLGGDAYCWGLGASGAGDNGLPTLVSSGLGLASVTSKMQHSCALASDQVGYCWGAGVAGKLGQGSTESSVVPVPVGSGLTFSAIKAGVQHTCGITTTHAVLCWGGILDALTTPTPVPGGHSFVAVSAGSTSCGVTPNGPVYCWGQGYSDYHGTTLVRIPDPEQP